MLNYNMPLKVHWNRFLGNISNWSINHMLYSNLRVFHIFPPVFVEYPSLVWKFRLFITSMQMISIRVLFYNSNSEYLILLMICTMNLISLLLLSFALFPNVFYSYQLGYCAIPLLNVQWRFWYKLVILILNHAKN